MSPFSQRRAIELDAPLVGIVIAFGKRQRRPAGWKDTRAVAIAPVRMTTPVAEIPGSDFSRGAARQSAVPNPFVESEGA
jgi:hypothetical protein